MSHKDGADHINVPDPLSEHIPSGTNRQLTSKELALQVNMLMARVGGSLIDKRKGTVLLSRAEWELLRTYMDELHANWMAEIRKNSPSDETCDGRSEIDRLRPALHQIIEEDPYCPEAPEPDHRHANRMAQIARAALAAQKAVVAPIDPWADMRNNCTCPKPGTVGSGEIDPFCPVAFPHPWHRVEKNGSAGT